MYGNYRYYKENLFPKILKDNRIPNEDKEKIKGLLAKPFNPYIRRHSALTEKSTKLKSSTLEQHAGWVPGSTIQKRYVHYFGNEPSIDILEAYGMKVNVVFQLIHSNPKSVLTAMKVIHRTLNSSKCKMIMSYDGYQDALESQKQKEDELSTMKQQFNTMQSQLQALIAALGSAKDQNQVNHTAEMLYKAGILNLYH